MAYTVKTAAQETVWASSAIKDAHGYLANVERFLKDHQGHLIRMNLPAQDVGNTLVQIIAAVGMAAELDRTITETIDSIGALTE
jgi:hypothetical protein